MCWEPNVMRLLTGGALYFSTYARRNCPPGERTVDIGRGC